MRSALLFTAIMVLGVGCGTSAERGTPVRGATKADGTNSCEDRCGGQAPAGCWCDASCVQYGDCCTDKGTYCDAEPPSCIGHCGGQSSSGCWCDASCAQYGDCCGDKEQVCGASCASANNCMTCLEIAGCNWSGGGCAEHCAMDTYCYGPENPAATTCPIPHDACPQITDEQECITRPDCEPMYGVCLMYCQPGDPGCCEFQGCKPTGCPPVMCTLACEHGFKKGDDGCEICECADPPQDPCWGSWLDQFGNCRTPSDGVYPDECCDTERQTKCQQIDQSYVQAVQAAKACLYGVPTFAPQCTQYVDDSLICQLCGTYVENASGLQEHLDAFKSFKCGAVPFMCPEIMCEPPTGATCASDGKCQDVFQ